MENLQKIISSLDKPRKFSQLKRDTGLANGVLQHHINHSDRIVKRKSAVMKKNQCKNCNLNDICDSKCIHSTLQKTRKNEIANLFEKGLSQAEIAEKMNLSRPTVNYHIKTLREANIVEGESIERSVSRFL
jgi:radical SAM protein with 4Fe4S-binding SPASM domain